MSVLIVESNVELGEIWKVHIERTGCEVHLVQTQEDAISQIQSHDIDVIVLDLVLDDGSAIAVADFASYRLPHAKVIFVTNTTFFSDGSIFEHISNAQAFLQRETPPEDLAQIVKHHSRSD